MAKDLGVVLGHRPGGALALLAEATGRAGINVEGESVERSRPRMVAERPWANVGWLAQAALATAAGWVLARQIFGHERPIVAPWLRWSESARRSGSAAPVPDALPDPCRVARSRQRRSESASPDRVPNRHPEERTP